MISSTLKEEDVWPGNFLYDSISHHVACIISLKSRVSVQGHKENKTQEEQHRGQQMGTFSKCLSKIVHRPRVQIGYKSTAFNFVKILILTSIFFSFLLSLRVCPCVEIVFKARLCNAKTKPCHACILLKQRKSVRKCADSCEHIT